MMFPEPLVSVKFCPPLVVPLTISDNVIFPPPTRVDNVTSAPSCNTCKKEIFPLFTVTTPASVEDPVPFCKKLPERV